jgi:hypothetical protein
MRDLQCADTTSSEQKVKMTRRTHQESDEAIATLAHISWEDVACTPEFQALSVCDGPLAGDVSSLSVQKFSSLYRDQPIEL